MSSQGPTVVHMIILGCVGIVSVSWPPFSKNNVYAHSFIYLLVTTLRPASPGFATWRIGGFGDFLPIWRFWQLFGDFFGPF